MAKYIPSYIPEQESPTQAMKLTGLAGPALAALPPLFRLTGSAGSLSPIGPPTIQRSGVGAKMS